MRNLTLILTLFIPTVMFGQGVFNNTASTALQQVIGDYPNHFKNIQGEIVSKEAQSTDYSSTVALPGSISAVVTKYSSTNEKNNLYTWKCLISQSEDFEMMAKKYKELYGQLRNAIIKIEGRPPFILNGNYEVPSEDKKFAITDFYLLPSSGNMKKLKIELSLEFYVTEWKMALTVYDQKEEGAFVKE